MAQACVCDDAVVTIKTSQGEKQVHRSDIVQFPDGLFGFSRYTDYVIFDIIGCPPFKTMLSVVEGGPDFVVVEPLSVFSDYRPVENCESLAGLGIDTRSEIVVLSIVTLTDDPRETTVNLRGPIILNTANNHARQIALADDAYSTRESFLAW